MRADNTRQKKDSKIQNSIINPKPYTIPKRDEMADVDAKPKKRATAKDEANTLSQTSQTPILARPLAYSDLDVNRWREYNDIETGSLWMFEGRERKNGHQLDYHGNCVPQILTQLLTRYTKADDVILDLFLGSGTSAIEAANLGRKAIGVEIQPEMAAYVRQKLAEQGKANSVEVINADSTNQEFVEKAVGRALKKLKP